MNEPEGGGGGWEVPKAEGIALLERGQSEDAVERLRDAASGDPTGETHALLALAHFHRERHSLAADCYTKALAADGDQPELGPHRAIVDGKLAGASTPDNRTVRCVGGARRIERAPRTSSQLGRMAERLLGQPGTDRGI